MLDITRRAHSQARRARRGLWFPLVLFGAIILLASPLYEAYGPGLNGAAYPVIPRTLSRVSFAGGYLLKSPLAVSLFWLVALTLGYGGTVVFYRMRAGRSGIAGSVRGYVLTGLALLAIQVALPWFGEFPAGVTVGVLPGDLLVRGLTPLLTIPLSLLVLAWAERSEPLAIFAVFFVALALLANLYDMSNLFRIRTPEPAINVIIPGAILLIAGVAFWVAGRRVH